MAAYYGGTKYVGEEKIVIAMDIGTTQSAVSFAYLYPDDNPRVRMVTRWPGQLESAGFSKIPTLVAYQGGSCKACGPKAKEYFGDADYEVAKWFKLHLHPHSMKVSDLPILANSSNFDIPILPSDVNVIRVYADFMRYLMENARKSFEHTIMDGPAIWKRLRPGLVVILTTPNGWELSQQDALRKASIQAGVVTEESAYELLEFVTEGEASVHYTLAYSQIKTWLSAGTVFAVIDAGGSTVDSTLYECKFTDPKVILEEVCLSQCIQAGGTFVDRTAETLIRKRLQGSKFDDDEYISDMVAAFENETKRLYDGSQEVYQINFGSNRDNDPLHGVIKGKLSLTEAELSSCFDGVIPLITESCRRLLGDHRVKYAVLVGGFGESAYLQRRLGELFDRHGVSVVTAEEPSKKAAAEGAMLWFIQQNVTARIARSTLGISKGVPYRPDIQEHARRIGLVFTNHAGHNIVRGVFDVLLTKGTIIQSQFTQSRIYHKLYKSKKADLGDLCVDIEVWHGEDIPQWALDSNGEHIGPMVTHTPSHFSFESPGQRASHMRTLCTLKADLSQLRRSLQPRIGSNGQYYQVDITLVLRMGGTQLQARLQWKDGTKLREGPVSIIPSATI